MIEVRAARSDELDAMLAVMCEAFSLPFAPARDLFYRDPYFDIDRKRVLVEDGLVVSCLTLVESNVWIGAANVRIAGIANVATLQSHRDRGLATQLLKRTLLDLHERDFGFAGLMPLSYGFYRRLGWEVAGTQYRLRVPATMLPGYAEARYVRSALPSDREGMARLYDERTAARTGYCLRDDKRWGYLFEHVRTKIIYKRESLDGYALYDVSDSGDMPARLRLIEMHARTEAARRGILGHLAQRAREVEEVEMTAGWAELDESGLPLAASESGQPAAAVEASPGLMLRVVNLPRALRDLAPGFPSINQPVTLVVHDPLAPAGACMAATLLPGESGVTVECADRFVQPRRRIEGTVGAWSQLLAGHHSLADLLSLNRVRAYSDSTARAAAPLFPRRAFYLPTADHF